MLYLVDNIEVEYLLYLKQIEYRKITQILSLVIIKVKLYRINVYHLSDCHSLSIQLNLLLSKHMIVSYYKDGHSIAKKRSESVPKFIYHVSYLQFTVLVYLDLKYILEYTTIRRNKIESNQNYLYWTWGIQLSFSKLMLFMQ